MCCLTTTIQKSYSNPLTFSKATLLNQETITVKGTVKNQDSNEALSGVTVSVVGTSIVTTTNSQGQFELKNVPKNGQILFSIIGFQSLSENVNLRNTINVNLLGVNENIDEVVVVGYGTQKRKDLTGSVSSIKSDDYKDHPITTASSALQGRVPGVAVNNSSGNPGADVKIRIRGANSINTSNDPLLCCRWYCIRYYGS